MELSLGYRFEDVLVVERAASFPRYGTFNFPVDYRSFSEELVLNFPTKEELEEQRPRGLQSIIGMGSVVTQLAFVLSARSEYRIEEVNGFVIHEKTLPGACANSRACGLSSMSWTTTDLTKCR